MTFTSDELLEWGTSPLVHSERGILRDLHDFVGEWCNGSHTVEVHTSGSTGVPKLLRVSKEKMKNSARLTCEYFHLLPGDTLLLCMPLRYIAGKMMVVRALEGRMNLMVVEPSGHPFAEIDFSLHLDFVAMVPMQMFQTLRNPIERKTLNAVGQVLLGGGAIDASLEEELQSLDCKVYSSYGMTETLSHIALRQLNGQYRTENYCLLPHVRITLSERETLVIHAPLVCEGSLETNDRAVIHADGSFSILGRTDNTINSGGVKIQIEEVEYKLKSILTVPYAVTFVPDERLGQTVALLIQTDSICSSLEHDVVSHLPGYDKPRFIFAVNQIPLTHTGKINRAACRSLALSCWQKNQ